MAGVRVHIRDGTRDETWDAFVATAAGGSHVQSARWSVVKAEAGWRVARVVAEREGTVVGGCQLLLRRVGPATLAYAPRGPIVAGDDEETLDAVLRGVEAVAARKPLTYLKVQPPVDRFDLSEELARRGFVASDLEAAPIATVLVDLAEETEAILSRMRSGTRANIGKARRRGVTIRHGGLADFEAFGALLESTGRRQGFSPYPTRYFHTMWREFAADGQACLVLAEHEGRPVSGLLIVGFNDTAAFKIGGWAGQPSSIRPNELAHFSAMEWARERGYRYYDLEGFSPEIERDIARGSSHLDATSGVAWFKLGLGGEVRVMPGAYDSSPSRFVRAGLRVAAPRLGAARGTALRLLGRR